MVLRETVVTGASPSARATSSFRDQLPIPVSPTLPNDQPDSNTTIANSAQATRHDGTPSTTAHHHHPNISPALVRKVSGSSNEGPTREPPTIPSSPGINHEPLRPAPALPDSPQDTSRHQSPRTSQEVSRPAALAFESSLGISGLETPVIIGHQSPSTSTLLDPPDTGGADDEDIEDFLAWRQTRASKALSNRGLATPPSLRTSLPSNRPLSSIFPTPPEASDDTAFLSEKQTASTLLEASDDAAFLSEKQTASTLLEASDDATFLSEKQTASTPPMILQATTAGPPPDWYPQSLPSPIAMMADSRSVGTPQSIVSAISQTANSVSWDPGADISSFDAVTSRGHGLPEVTEQDEIAPQHRTWQEQQAWEQIERVRKEEELAKAMSQAQIAERERAAEEEWHRGEQEALRSAVTIGQLETGTIAGTSGLDLTPVSATPPSRTATTNTKDLQIAARTKKQSGEVYRIKHITWTDPTPPATELRTSPILVQNANGPCPLLALVNALTLSTPRYEPTVLTETLRVREQVSLGLLLDAVFDELTTGRRGDTARVLPDVTDLYAFLLTLHSGMNVNPCFFPALATDHASVTVGAMTEAGAGGLSDLAASSFGTFEETREMKLYSTFSIPLLHGWLPPLGHPAYIALERSAKTYEDAQNFLFRDEALREKQARGGLDPRETEMLQDIFTIQTFLDTSATQLTNYGLQQIIYGMRPGSIAILFRNDHFSTLYKHPRDNRLLQLVTDVGYAGHPEVVWESLVDVTGERSEFFAGDLRPVGVNATDSPARDIPTGIGDSDGWETVEDRRSSRRRKAVGSTTVAVTGPAPASSSVSSPPSTITPTVAVENPTSTEQEDHDLALAIQLHEEEVDRCDRSLAQRLQAESLSEDLIARTQLNDHVNANANANTNTINSTFNLDPAQSNRRNLSDYGPVGVPANHRRGPEVPPRGHRLLTSGRNIPNTNRPVAEGDLPPPCYEQAATTTPYYPPPNDPAFAGLPPPPRFSRTSIITSVAGAGNRTGLRAQAARLIDEVTAPPGAPPGMGRVAGDPFSDPSHGAAQGTRRRETGGPVTGGRGEYEREKNCVVM